MIKNKRFKGNGVTIKFKNDTVSIRPNSNKTESFGRVLLFGGCVALIGTLLHAYVNNSNNLNQNNYGEK